MKTQLDETEVLNKFNIKELDPNKVYLITLTDDLLMQNKEYCYSVMNKIIEAFKRQNIQCLITAQDIMKLDEVNLKKLKATCEYMLTHQEKKNEKVSKN